MKDNIIKIKYAGAALEISAFLGPLWPFDMLLDDWPTFCGAGQGFGDWLVPDTIYGVRVAPACLQHDVEWAIADGSYKAFMTANCRFRRNLGAMVKIQLTGWRRSLAVARCNTYFLVVSSPIGWANFDPGSTDPYKNEAVRAKIKRLSQAALGIPVDKL